LLGCINIRKKELSMSLNAATPIGIIPTRAFGKTGIEVTVTGLGGEGVLYQVAFKIGRGL
jgi:hypothetical protein